MKIPPVVQFCACALLAWLLARYLVVVPMSVSPMLPLAIGLIGGVFLIFALLSFRKRKTTINPMEPSNASTLVTDGIYRITRNPMYLGLLLLLLAWCFWLGDLSTLISVPIFVVIMTILQIYPEERALVQLFGDEYRNYQGRVSRWLLF